MLLAVCTFLYIYIRRCFRNHNVNPNIFYKATRIAYYILVVKDIMKVTHTHLEHLKTTTYRHKTMQEGWRVLRRNDNNVNI